MTEPSERRKEGQMPRKRPANGTVQLNVWISVEAKQYLDERSEREDRHLNELIEEYM